jgi:hypothetical protein
MPHIRERDQDLIAPEGLTPMAVKVGVAHQNCDIDLTCIETGKQGAAISLYASVTHIGIVMLPREESCAQLSCGNRAVVPNDQ